jgi:hypothetical protein
MLDAGFEGTRPYLVSEFVPGPTLAEVVAANGPLLEEAVRGVATGAATALVAIHQAGLVHGHLGPRTLVLGPEGPRVVHFSITPPYGAATPAADMLAWARTVLFAAGATGWPGGADGGSGRAGGGPGRGQGEPGRGQGERGGAPASGSGQPDLAALPGDLRTVVAQCLSPDPVGRPSAREVLAELLSGHNVAAGLLATGARLAQAAVRTPVSSSPQLPGRRSRRRRSAAVLWAAAFAACVLAIVAAVVYITRHAGPPGPAARAKSAAARDADRPPRIPPGMTGRWAGIIRQARPALSLTVRLSLGTGGGKTGGTVAYPALGCSGTLTVTSAAPGRLVLHQAIAAGRDNCESGTVTLTQAPGGKLTFTFGRPGTGRPTGTLARR